MNKVNGVSFDATEEEKTRIKDNLIELAIKDA